MDCTDGESWVDRAQKGREYLQAGAGAGATQVGSAGAGASTGVESALA
jgi:hypothetical protein